MVKTASTTSDGATKKKSLFGKIFKKKSKKKNQVEEEKEEEHKVEIVVENVVEQVEETRDEDIPRDPSATSPRPSSVASPRDVEEQAEESANPDREPVLEERDVSDDILADLQHEEANPTPAPQQGWFGSWLDGMTHMCGPPQDQGLPTIMSGEEMEMDMDMITNGESRSVVSPTSTVKSEAPMSPVTPKVEEAEGELNKNKKAEPEELKSSDKKEEPKEEEEVKKAPLGKLELTEAELSPRAPVDAPTTPKSLVVSPRGATKVEEVEEISKIIESPKAAEAPKEENDTDTVGDSTVGDNTLIVSPQKDAQASAEPAGAKLDIFSTFTACCNPVAAPSMDETEGVKAGEATDDASIKEEGGPQEPDGDKEDETKSVHQDSQSVVAEKGQEKAAPTTPVSKDAPEDAEPERIVGTIHKVKKNSKMGLSLKNSTMYQGVFIAKIKAGSLFSKTDLREGMQVLEIQGKPCPTALEEAVNMLRHAVGDLEIVAQKPKCEI